MSAFERLETPIYAQLVRERGDIPTQTRVAAEEALQRTARVVDFQLPWTAHRQR